MPVSVISSSLRASEAKSVTYEAPMLHEHVVELSDELAGQFLFVGLLGDDRLPRPPEIVDEAGEGKRRGLSRNRAAFEPKWRKSRCSMTPAASAISRVVVLR